MTGSLHGSARTTPRVRAELQASQEATSILAQRYGLSRTTVAKWRARTTTDDAPMGPSSPGSTVLAQVEEAMVGEFRDDAGTINGADLLRGVIKAFPYAEHGIKHRLTKPYHPRTNGQAERMSRTVKEATIKAFHYPDLESLKAHVLAFVSAKDFAKHFKTVRPVS